MTPEQFFQLYANLPLAKRVISVDVNRGNGTMDGRSLNTIYNEVKRIQDLIRPHVIERDELLRIAQEYFIKEDII